MKNKKVVKICFTGLMAAIIAVFTAFVKMPTGINDGYLHFGDSMIYTQTISLCSMRKMPQQRSILCGVPGSYGGNIQSCQFI